MDDEELSESFPLGDDSQVLGAERRRRHAWGLDLLGGRIATLVDGIVPVGPHTMSVDALGWPAWTYVYRLRAGRILKTRGMTVVR